MVILKTNTVSCGIIIYLLLIVFMKQLKFFLMAALCSMFVLSSCSDDDGLSGTPSDVSEEIVKAFYEMYPNATNVSWTSIDDYDVARFYDEETRAEMRQTNCTAWFSRISKRWGMTDREIPFNSLPSAVIQAFNDTIYSQAPWTVDDEANVLERADSETFYVIEVDKNENAVETDVDLYYTETGRLVQALTNAPEDDNHIDFIPEEQPMTPSEFVADRYPGSHITDRDWDDGFLEIEIRHEGREKDVYFNFRNEWVGSKWEVSRRSLPEGTWSKLWSKGYHDMDDDDIDVIDSRRGMFYAIEAERADDDWLIIVDEDGNIEKEIPEDWEDGWWGDLWDEWT